jgi:hypothetical protein
MKNSSDVVSFRIANAFVPFVLQVYEDGHTIVSECLLCLKFHLQETSLLVEREEFDFDGILLQIVYQKPYFSNSGTYYRVSSGTYTITGRVSSFDLSQASTLTPRSACSFDRLGHCRLKPLLPPMRESPEFTLLSNSDDEECDPRSSHEVKVEDLSPTSY